MNKNCIKIILVEPIGPINLGSVARLCENFGVDELRLVSPRCEPNHPEARKMAIKGKRFLDSPSGESPINPLECAPIGLKYLRIAIFHKEFDVLNTSASILSTAALDCP